MHITAALRALVLSACAAFAMGFASPMQHFFRAQQPGARTLLCATDTPPADGCALRQSLPQTFKAVWADRVGAGVRDVAVVREMPMRELQTGEVLVQVTFAGVNGGCETFRARGEHWFSTNRDAEAGFPLGAEGVGLVARVGEGVDGLSVGDAVSFVGGAFAEYVFVHEQRCRKIREASAASAAARISGTTAMGAVAYMGEAKPRQVVLVTAAAGAAGSFAVQIAKRLGCEVVGTCSTAAKARLLCGLGCDTIINHRTRDVGEALAKKYPKGVDLVVEHVGGKMFQTALEHLKPNGRLILVGYISEYPHNRQGVRSTGPGRYPSAEEESSSHAAYDLADIFWKQKTVQVAGTGQTISGKLYPSMEAAGEAGERVQAWLEEGRLRAVVDAREFKGVDSVADAVEYMLSGAASGKVVVRMSG